MKKSKGAKGNGRAEAKRIVTLVQHAIEDGANSVEEIHRSIAAKPLDVLERLDVFKDVAKDVRKVQDTSIGAVYELIHKVNNEVGKLAQELLGLPAAKKAAPRKAPKPQRASAHAR